MLCSWLILGETFAFWELAVISQKHPQRRKTIFEEIDRTGGATWSQVLHASLAVVEALDIRVISALRPSSEQAPATTMVQPGALQPLPRISTPLREEPIFAGVQLPHSRIEKVEATIGTFARSHGRTPAPAKNEATPLALSKRLFEYALDRLLTPTQKQKLSHSYFKARSNDYAMEFLRSALGSPFRQTLDRRARAIVLGSPSGDVGMVIDAIDAISRLATASISEDVYGKVQNDVPCIIRTFTGAIRNLETLQQFLTPHWTDVDADKRDRESDLHDVHVILRKFRVALGAVLGAFGGYAEELRISEKEMNGARRAARLDEEQRSRDASKGRGGKNWGGQNWGGQN